MLINPESALPLYTQVKEALMRQIRNGTYKSHQVLPAERELVDTFGVSRITVRRALSDLVNEGLLYRKVGKGTFVASAPIVETLTELVGHIEELQRRNLNPEVTVVEFAYVTTPDEAAMSLGDPEEVLFCRRLVKVEGSPLMVLDICVPADLGVVVDPELLKRVPINRLLEAQGFFPVAGEQRVASRGARESEAVLFQVPAGTPILEVLRTEWMVTNRGLLWSRAVYLGDRYQYVIRLHRRRFHG
jgi:GntR family transcriptional regulator